MRRTCWLVTAIALMWVAACTEDEASGEPDGTYTTRGILARLPSNNPGTEIHIKHEAIDDFEGREGKVVGMNSMTMAFEPADGLELDGLSKGDKVKFTFEVRWDARPMMRMTEIESLQGDPKLEFREAEVD